MVPVAVDQAQERDTKLDRLAMPALACQPTPQFPNARGRQCGRADLGEDLVDVCNHALGADQLVELTEVAGTELSADRTRDEPKDCLGDLVAAVVAVPADVVGQNAVQC